MDYVLQPSPREEEARAEEWHITDDGRAEWALKEILKIDAVYGRLEADANAEIVYYQERLCEIQAEHEKKVKFLKSELFKFFQHQVCETTKTLKKYRLVSGTLQEKTLPLRYTRENGVLEEYLKEHLPEYVSVETKEETKIDWAGLKKFALENGTTMLNPKTEEVIPGITVEHRDPVFDIV